MTNYIQTDVFIAGGDPVGLLIAYCLARQARQGVDSVLVEQYVKKEQAMYGRATTLYPRTLELLDQLDLLEDLNQIGYIGRNSVTYKDGKRVTSRGWHVMFERMHGTFLDYCLNLRQKYLEEVIQGAYEKLGGQAFAGWKLESYSVDNASGDDYKVTSHVREIQTDRLLTVKGKYIVGADGGRSLVRRTADIPFNGDHTKFKWVQLDHGVKRIGFAMTDAMIAKYGGKLTEEQAKEEAILSMHPFTLEFESVDWWTLYSINQRVADTFFANNRVLLAGDACHTHSSGAAQGMNTRVHDAVNLAWKLGGMMKGWYKAAVLQTYDSERRPLAMRLIELDKAFSATISGQVPDSHKDAYADSNELFTKLFNETIQFNVGLGINYPENIINKALPTGMVSAGWRAPDALVYGLGSRVPTRLFHRTKNVGQWSIIVFAGQPALTREIFAPAVKKLKEIADTLPSGMARFLTLVAQSAAEGDQMFDTPKIGNVYYDQDRSAHTAYTISTRSGAVAVLPPDGILGHAVFLDEIDSLVDFFKGFT
ncbi:hypothetical protein PENANT_c002G06541 [Penicillium antarcticum]|uniref:FAD-binding domain-containing protein n=1 Tax=Penicillium antarcticum TaxID=416450 RepID=A0A1V6QKS0_9EURO|nr:uncharacterized protein N7508_008428 [Penicillium antarcticum]KAJ5293607.1 hypothetical protein N7508_008428 [Penicillium antarcticum]OQD89834.1 hypothetical protein PENANT_c002G06541 [Penicillium antarcticum]